MLSSRAHQAARSTGETRIYQTLDVDPIYEEVTGVGLGGQRRRTESLARRGHEQEIEVAPAEGDATGLSGRNAAEHWSAVIIARDGNMQLAMNIAKSSSVQIALMVAPLLILLDDCYCVSGSCGSVSDA